MIFDITVFWLDYSLWNRNKCPSWCLIRLNTDFIPLETHSETLCLPSVVGFLQSGSKLLFRRRRREKEACLSQSHEDISNMGNSFAAASTGSRKTSGSFSRRLIKHFSFRSSGKSKAKAAATNGGSSPLGNWLFFWILVLMALMVITVKRTLTCKSKDSKQAYYPRRVVTCVYWKEETSGRALLPLESYYFTFMKNVM